MVDGAMPIEKAACSERSTTTRRRLGSTPGPCDNPAARSRSGEAFPRSHSKGNVGSDPSVSLDVARPRA